MEKSVNLTPDIIRAVSDKFSLEIVFIFELPSAGVKDMSALEHCTNLLHVILSHNKISRIRGLDYCRDLVYLDLSYNQISRVEGLSNCIRLEKLELQGNRIASTSNLEELSPLPALASLYLREFNFSGNNPICNEEGYRGIVFNAIPSLKSLDGHRKHLPVLMHDDYSAYENNFSGLSAGVDKTPWVKEKVSENNEKFDDPDLEGLIKQCKVLLDKGQRIIDNVK